MNNTSLLRITATAGT